MRKGRSKAKNIDGMRTNYRNHARYQRNGETDRPREDSKGKEKYEHNDGRERKREGRTCRGRLG